MTADAILLQVINQEFDKYKRTGYPIKLKALTKRRWKYTLWCGLAALLCWPLIPIVLLVYIFLMCNANNANTILKIAKKHPDTPVDQIIAWEIRQ